MITLLEMYIHGRFMTTQDAVYSASHVKSVFATITYIQYRWVISNFVIGIGINFMITDIWRFNKIFDKYIRAKFKNF